MSEANPWWTDIGKITAKHEQERSAYGDEARQVFLPYCIQQIADGRYVVLNRNYKPLGFRTRDWVDYGDYAVPLRITAKQAEKLSYEGSPNTSFVCFYNDGCIPTASVMHMRAYLDRLAAFAKLGIKRRSVRQLLRWTR